MTLGELTGIIMAIISIVAGAATILGFWVNFSNEVALLKLRSTHLEDKVKSLEDRMASHENDLHNIIMQLKEDINELKIEVRVLIDQNKRDDTN